MESYAIKKINSHIYIKDTIEFLQYEININGIPKLLTFIGETHTNNRPCLYYNHDKCIEHKQKLKHTWTIAEYITFKLENNPNIKILLEYSPDVSIETIQSDALIHISNLIKSDVPISKKIKEVIIPTDFRTIFLGKYQHELYNNPYLQYADKKYIFDKFIMPFYDHYNLLTIPDDSRYKYTENDNNYINSYLLNMDKVFKEISSDLDNKVENIKKLQRHWANITEYFSLKEIFNLNSTTSEYIIIVGLAHIDNWKKIFGKGIVEKNRISGIYCICLNETLYFKDIARH